VPDLEKRRDEGRLGRIKPGKTERTGDNVRDHGC